MLRSRNSPAHLFREPGGSHAARNGSEVIGQAVWQSGPSPEILLTCLQSGSPFAGPPFQGSRSRVPASPSLSYPSVTLGFPGFPWVSPRDRCFHPPLRHFSVSRFPGFPIPRFTQDPSSPPPLSPFARWKSPRLSPWDCFGCSAFAGPAFRRPRYWWCVPLPLLCSRARATRSRRPESASTDSGRGGGLAADPPGALSRPTCPLRVLPSLPRERSDPRAGQPCASGSP